MKKRSIQIYWWQIVGTLIFLSGLVYRRRDIGMIQENLLDPSALYRVVLMGLVFWLLLARLIIKRLSWFRSLLRGIVGLLTGYVMICMLSSLWSVNPWWTFYKSIEYFVDVLFLASVINSIRTIEQLKALFDWLMILTGLLLLTVWIGVFLLPGEAIKYGIGLLGIQILGVFPAVAANSVGEIGAALAIFTFARSQLPMIHKWFYRIIFVFATLSLVFSQSRSPLMGFVVAIPLMLFLNKRIGILGFIIVLFVVLLSFTHAEDLFFEFFRRGQTPEMFESLSGRRTYWDQGFEVLRQQPLIGYGAYAGGRFYVLGELLRLDEVSSVHNTWVEILLGTGILGFFLMSAAVKKKQRMPVPNKISTQVLWTL